MKKFKARKRNKYKLLKIIILFSGLFFFIIKYSNVLESKSILSYLYSDFRNEKINDVEFLLKYAINLDYKPKAKETLSVKESIKSNDKPNPLIYIYNTHQKEEYKSGFLDNYNIKSTVLIASYILKENLANQNIETLVETADLVEIRNNLNLKYGKSYYVSRLRLEEAFNNNNSLEYFIDLHRDSGSHEKTSLFINNTSYAKLLFVVGLDNPTYESNLELATILNERINDKIPNLSRGVLKKSGKNVNGVYNQDFNKNVMLIEVGGENNTINEVSNTLEILALVLSEYIKGEENHEL